jgi:hypothetical protein
VHAAFDRYGADSPDVVVAANASGAEEQKNPNHGSWWAKEPADPRCYGFCRTALATECS